MIGPAIGHAEADASAQAGCTPPAVQLEGGLATQPDAMNTRRAMAVRTNLLDLQTCSSGLAEISMPKTSAWLWRHERAGTEPGFESVNRMPEAPGRACGGGAGAAMVAVVRLPS